MLESDDPDEDDEDEDKAEHFVLLWPFSWQQVLPCPYLDQHEYWHQDLQLGEDG